MSSAAITLSPAAPSRFRLRHLLVVGVVLALAAAGVMTLHTVRHAIRVWRAGESLRPWMSIPYIARSHHVPVHFLYEAVGLPAGHRDHRPIGRIARQQRRPVSQLISELNLAIARARVHDPPPARGGFR